MMGAYSNHMQITYPYLPRRRSWHMDTLRMSIEGPSSSLDAVCRIILYCGFFSNRGYSAGAGLDTWTPGHTLNVSIECPSYSLDAVCCIPRLLLQQRVFCGWQAWVLDPSLSEARTITWSRQHQRWILYRGIPHRAGNSFLNGYLRASWSISLRLDQTFTLIFTGTNLGLCLRFLTLFWSLDPGHYQLVHISTPRRTRTSALPSRALCIIKFTPSQLRRVEACGKCTLAYCDAFTFSKNLHHVGNAIGHASAYSNIG